MELYAVALMQLNINAIDCLALIYLFFVYFFHLLWLWLQGWMRSVGLEGHILQSS